MHEWNGGRSSFTLVLPTFLWHEVKSEGLSGLSQWNDTEWWINVGQSHWGKMWTESAVCSLQLPLLSCFFSITSICSVYSGECPGTAAFFFLYSVCLCNQTQRLIALFWGLRGLWHCSTLIDFATLSIYVSPLLIFSVTQAVSLGSVNTVWESLWHYVHSISELKKHQQTLIPRQETPLQHKATSQSLAVKISRNLFQ